VICMIEVGSWRITLGSVGLHCGLLVGTTESTEEEHSSKDVGSFG
jgi:hypothetical protein